MHNYLKSMPSARETSTTPCDGTTRKDRSRIPGNGSALVSECADDAKRALGVYRPEGYCVTIDMGKTNNYENHASQMHYT